MTNIKRYIYAFIITLIIFFFSLWLSDALSDKKIQSLRDIENQISLNILSVETRFSLLQKTSCEHIGTDKETTIGFNTELNELALKIKSLENQLGYYNEDVISLKKYYSLLQIKDYLLIKEYQERCKQKTTSILYFHDIDCEECARQSIILDKITSDYPEIRVYYFDKSTNMPAIDTLASVFKIGDTTPSLVMHDRVYRGYKNIQELEALLPEIEIWKKQKNQNSTSTSSTSIEINKNSTSTKIKK